MTRAIPLLAAGMVAFICTLFTGTSAHAQGLIRLGFFPRTVPTVDRHRHDTHRSHHSGGRTVFPTHHASIAELDRQADQLAEVARHLHDDAHQLSQDYAHSHSIESTVMKLERLQEHMHQMLHAASNSRYASSDLIDHVAEDMNSVRSLLLTLHRELQHQGMDGARRQDYVTIRHMRQVITGEALPLLQRMELTLYGSPQRHDVHTSHRHAIDTHHRSHSPRRPSTRLSLPGLQIQF